MDLTHIDLFSGIGGFALAAQRAGFQTEVFCEKDKFCQKVLKKHWSKTPIIPDVRDFDGTKWREATILTGGFPCQPFSQAGKRRGKDDDRYLWPEMFRVISEARPAWVLAENVAGIINMALDQTLADLESEGYETRTFVIPALSLNAPHRRDRAWIIAHDARGKKSRGIPSFKWEKISKIRKTNNFASNSRSQGLGRGKYQGRIDDPLCYRGTNWEKDWVEIATKLCRVDDGLSVRLDGFELSKFAHRRERLKALGNAIVPQIAEVIMSGIYDIEKELRT